MKLVGHGVVVRVQEQQQEQTGERGPGPDIHETLLSEAIARLSRAGGRVSKGVPTPSGGVKPGQTEARMPAPKPIRIATDFLQHAPKVTFWLGASIHE